MQNAVIASNTGGGQLSLKLRKGFTLSETLITLLIVGILAAVSLPVVQKMHPDKLEAMRKKSYYILENTVAQIYSDDTMYRENIDGSLPGFRNTEKVKINGNIFEGKTKFCELFANAINKRGGINTNCAVGQKTFTSADNVDWYLPVTDFSQGYAEIKFDVNGKEEPNCEYNASACKHPDIFKYYILSNGKIMEENPNLTKATYCIKTTIEGNGTVSPSAEYCGLENGTYTLTAVPNAGWTSNWSNNKKTVKIKNKDEVRSITFTESPKACIKLNVICDAGTPDKCANYGVTNGTFTSEGNTLIACNLPSNSYIVSVTPKSNFTSSWQTQEVLLNGVDQSFDVNLIENKYCAILDVSCPDGGANVCGTYTITGNGSTYGMDTSGSVAKTCALKNGAYKLSVSPFSSFKTNTTDKSFTIANRDWSDYVNFTKKMLGLIEIPCSKFEGYAECESVIQVENEDTLTTEYLGTNNNGKDYDLMCANKDGDEMCWGLADKVCQDKGLRLPNASELHAMYVAAEKGTISSFESANYWAEKIGNSYAHNCYMGRGNCGRGDVNSYTNRHVRCVK